MSDQSIQSDVGLISRAIDMFPGDEISGARLNQLIRAANPGFDVRAAVGMPVGQGALSKFVDKFLSSTLERSGRTGADVLYRRKNAHSAILSPEEPERLWKTFASPASDKQLVLDRSSYRLRVQPRTLPPKVTDTPIGSVNYSELRQITEEFLSKLSDGEREKIGDVSSDSMPYYDWVMMLRKVDPALNARWSVFRRDRIRSIFQSRLANLGLPRYAELALCAQLDTSQRQEYLHRVSETKKTTTQPPRDQVVKPPHKSQSLNHVPDDSLVLARSAAKATIDSMNLCELRSLQLPVGAMIDAGIFRLRLPN
jgi:hypothetical protein